MKLPTHPLSRARNVSVMLFYIARGTIEREARFLRRGALENDTPFTVDTVRNCTRPVLPVEPHARGGAHTTEWHVQSPRIDALASKNDGYGQISDLATRPLMYRLHEFMFLS